ncbi:MAG TPA: Asp-tRNA(Asn)/Glu-tRNA(Gln) amidotransferase subunit GatA [Chitinophagaceae bacterium]
MFGFSSIEQYQRQLHEGKLTCLQAVEFYLAEIERNTHLNAFIEVFADEALKRARKLDLKKKENGPVGKLFGVVIGLKDVICYKDHTITAASRILKNFKPVYSATAVERLLQEDAIIIGNLNCDEFAMGSTNENSVYGPVLNAADPSRVSGGSSGGSAVAVQAGLCMVSLGSDTGGSVRQPADFCGVVGIKPTYGRISRYGLIAYASSFDQIGIFGKNIHDVAAVLEVIQGPDDFDSTVSHQPGIAYSAELKSTVDKKYKIAYFPEALEHPSLDKEIGSSIQHLLGKLQSQGHVVDPVHFDLLDYIVPAYYILTTAEASSNLSRYDGVKFGYRNEKATDLTDFYTSNRSQGFGWEVKRRIMLGTFVLSTGYYDAYFTKAQQVRQQVLDKLSLIFSEFDFIILPTSPSVAFKLGENSKDPIAIYLADIYTVLANLAGLPAASIPLFTHTNGMPYGVQVMANRFYELSLLRFSDELLKSR